MILLTFGKENFKTFQVYSSFLGNQGARFKTMLFQNFLSLQFILNYALYTSNIFEFQNFSSLEVGLLVPLHLKFPWKTSIMKEY